MKIIVALSILILLILLISNKIKPFLFGSVACALLSFGVFNLSTWLSSCTSESLIVLILLLLVSLAIEKSVVIS